MRTSCRQQLAPPPRDAAKMSPRITIGPEPVLAAHSPSPPAAGSHCPQADQDFERFGKTLIANFKDTATLWEFLRASLRQCHIHKLSKVGKDKTAWAKSDEYLTNLMDSDTVLTLENTDLAINCAQNYMQRQDNDGE